LGKLGLQIGGVTETVTITSEITPVQVADSSAWHNGRRDKFNENDYSGRPPTRRSRSIA
jgi:hypothetical protein